MSGDTLYDLPPGQDDPIHLLAVADTKMGKSVYSAQAAVDGFGVIYLDCDNGRTAIEFALKGNDAAKKRLRYYPFGRPSAFLQNLFRSTAVAPMRWIPRTNGLWGPMAVGLEEDDVVWEFNIKAIPSSYVLVIDAWTPVAADALGIGDATQSAVLLEGTDQQIYGGANVNLTYIVNMIQKLPCHVIVQAHGTIFERYEKPLNVKGSGMKQGEMILREVKDVPVSSSRAHGESMATRFNHIGWMSVDGAGETTIDFTRKATRVGGGPPNKIAKAKDLPFSKLVSRIPDYVEVEGWFKKTTHKEVVAAVAAARKSFSLPPAQSQIKAPALATPTTTQNPGLVASSLLTAKK